MANTVTALFETRKEGEDARNNLLARGFSSAEVSFVAADDLAREQPPASAASGEIIPEKYLEDAIGVAVEMMAILLPGAGPLVAAGPLATAISQKTSTESHGGIAGILTDHGLSPEIAARYAAEIQRGASLVMVHVTTGSDQDKARSVLEQSGAINREVLPAENSR